MPHLHFKNLDSTNLYLKNNYQKLPNWTIVSCDFQTHGKGRNNHLWQSEKEKNLLCSFLIKNPKILEKHQCLSLLIGSVIFTYLKSFNIKNLSIKWPNDILVEDKKIAGILLEGISEGNKIKAIVIGVGLNLNQKQFPKGINATSLILEKGVKVSIKEAIKKIETLLKKEIKLLLINKTNYLKTINTFNYLYRKKGLVNVNRQKKEATILNINENNSINVLIGKKKISIYADEITLHTKV